MTRINTNVASLRALQSVTNAQSQLSTTMTRLSTGLKINSGADDPSGLIASDALNSQITAINQSVQNSNLANNVISTADSALGQINGLLNQIRGLVQGGLNSGAMSQDQIQANQSQIDAALGAINKISGNTSFAGQKLIDGSMSFNTVVSSADTPKLADFQVNQALFGASSNITIQTTVTSVAKQGQLNYSGGALTSATTLEVAGSAGSQVLFFGASTTTQQIATAVNNVSDATGITAAYTSATAATLTSGSSSSANLITFTDATATADNASSTTATTVTFATAAASTTSVSVTTTGAITITLATSTSGGAVTATASSVAAAFATSSATSLVSIAATGTGVVAGTAAATALTGGSNAQLSLKSENYGSKEFASVNVLAGTFATKDANSSNAAATRSSGADVTAIINGQLATGSGLNASIHTATLDAQVSLDATTGNVANSTSTITVTGGGALFQIGQDVSVNGQIGLGIQAVNTARLGGVDGKLYQLGTGGGKSLQDVGPNVQGSTLVNILNEAMNKVSTLRGTLGAIQSDVIQTNVDSLGVALQNITQAKSDIVDTDFAAETANLTKDQILSQASMTVLGIANQQPNQVLNLLRG